jgi:hypothetical protein
MCVRRLPRDSSSFSWNGAEHLAIKLLPAQADNFETLPEGN